MPPFEAARGVAARSRSWSTTRAQAESAPFLKTSVELWQRMLAVNLTGSFLCAQAALPDMLDAGLGPHRQHREHGGQKGYAYVAAYTAAKHGVIGLTRSLALEVARKGITVNAVCPGYTDTDILRASVANVVGEDRPQRSRCAGGIRGRQSAAAHRAACRSGRCGALALRRRRRIDQRPVDLGLRGEVT